MTKQVNNSASRGIPNILINLKKQKNYIAKQLATKKKLEKQREKEKKRNKKTIRSMTNEIKKAPKSLKRSIIE